MKMREFLEGKNLRNKGYKGSDFSLPSSPTQYIQKTLADKIGIEVELEGALIFPDWLFEGDSGRHHRFWTYREEGSLRNGAELVLREPLDVKELDMAGEAFKELLAKSRPVESLRTSTHVHVSVSGWNYYDIYKVIGLWWLLENVLVRLHGSEREGNLFCLRVKDAENCVQGVIDSIHSKSGLGNYSPNEYKYSALNLSALPKYGSLEFRFMKGYTDFSDIKKWAVCLNHVCQKARKYDSLQDILDFLNTTSPHEFLKAFLTEDVFQDVVREIHPFKVSEMIMENICHTMRLNIVLESEFFSKAFSVRDHEDIDPSLRKGRPKYDIAFEVEEAQNETSYDDDFGDLMEPEDDPDNELDSNF